MNVELQNLLVRYARVWGEIEWLTDQGKQSTGTTLKKSGLFFFEFLEEKKEKRNVAASLARDTVKC